MWQCRGRSVGEKRSKRISKVQLVSPTGPESYRSIRHRLGGFSEVFCSSWFLFESKYTVRDRFRTEAELYIDGN